MIALHSCLLLLLLPPPGVLLEEGADDELDYVVLLVAIVRAALFVPLSLAQRKKKCRSASSIHQDGSPFAQ